MKIIVDQKILWSKFFIERFAPMADILLERFLDRPLFTWGSVDLAETGDDRKQYIESLIAADKGDYELLLDFVRS